DGILVCKDRHDRYSATPRSESPTNILHAGRETSQSMADRRRRAVVAAMFAERPGILGLFGEVSGIVSGLTGPGLATYTGVFVSNSAVPLWQESRHILPILFGASAMASAGSIFDMAIQDRRARKTTYTLGTIGRVVERSVPGSRGKGREHFDENRSSA